MKLHRILGSLAIALAVASNALADTVTGRVVSVLDGDTIDVLDSGNNKTRIRFANIDCPELKGQPWGRNAREAAADILAGKAVTVEVTTQDRYGRSIGLVNVDGIQANRELVRAGHCWVYQRYNNDPGLLDLQVAARKQRLGLWQLPSSERIEPWVWRRRK